MDFSKFKTPDWLMVGGGAAMLILGLLLPWSSVDLGPVSETGDNPFNYFLTGGISWILVSAVGVLALLRAMGKLPDSQPWSLIFLIAAGISAILMIIQLILGGRDIGFGVDADRGIGMYVAALAAIVTVVGAFLSFQSEGGELSDLTNVDKLKESFAGDGDASGDASGDDAPPPPPPPPQQPES